MSRPYGYKALDKDEIRILNLKLGEPNDELEGNLHVRQLRNDERNGKEPDHTPGVFIFGPEEEAPKAEEYEALSYSWGMEPKPGEPKPFIKILEGGDSYKIPIRSNLEAALLQFRTALTEEMPVLHLWIDALCIDQENQAEKNSQIPRMAEIYSQAVNVRVWLGKKEKGDKSDIAMRFIPSLLNLHEFDDLVNCSGTAASWDAFSLLMRRPWFSRRWIVQEIALARTATLHCGEEQVKWTEFADAVSLFISRHDDIRKLFRGSSEHGYPADFLGEVEELGANRLVDAACNLFRKADDGTVMEHLMSLEALMSTMSVFEASDFHDTVYAILWLANDAQPVAGQGSSLAESHVDHTPGQSALNSPTSATSQRHHPVLQTQYITEELVQTPTAFNSPKNNVDQFFSRCDTGNATGTIVPLGVIPATDPLGPMVNSFEPQRPYLSPKYMTPQSSNYLQAPAVNHGRKRSVSDTSLYDAENKFRRRDDPPKHQIEVDYNKNVFEVCQDFLKFAIGRSQSLDIICRPWAPKHSSLPTWVPQISGAAFGVNRKNIYNRIRADPLVGLPGTGKKNYNASGKTKAIWSTGVDKTLRVTGFVLDTVYKMDFPAQAGNIPSSWLELVSWDAKDPSPPDEFWRTLVADRGPGGHLPPPALYRLACEHAFKQRTAGGDLSTGEQLIDNECPSIVKAFLRRVQSVVFRRRLIRSHGKKGANTKTRRLLGLAPDNAKCGDLICILYGCSVPVLLRKKLKRKSSNLSDISEDAQTTHQAANGTIPQGRLDHSTYPLVFDTNEGFQYEFIGECYIHGMMAGEAFRYQKNHRINDQPFDLL